MSTLAGPGLIFWGFSLTFMAIDWVMSINPEWFSTMFGLLFIADQGLTGMAFLITVMVLLSTRRPMSEVLTPRHLHDLGKFLLAMVMVWAYFSFSQFLIIWAGNLPEEIPYYLVRINDGWGFVALALVFGHFALPFALLLSRDLKRNFKLLASIAVFILFMRLVDLYWVVAPEFRRNSFGVSWMDFTMPAGADRHLAGLLPDAARKAAADARQQSAPGGGSAAWKRITSIAPGFEETDVNVIAVGKVGIALLLVTIAGHGAAGGRFQLFQDQRRRRSRNRGSGEGLSATAIGEDSDSGFEGRSRRRR